MTWLKLGVPKQTGLIHLDRQCLLCLQYLTREVTHVITCLTRKVTFVIKCVHLMQQFSPLK